MHVHKKQTDSHQEKLLSLASKSKQDFIREYKMYDEASGRGVYLQVLNDITKAISYGNVDNFQKLSHLIEHIGDVKSQVTLKDYYDNASNPILSTNLIILACKHNKVEILKSLFSNGRVLDNLSINVGKDVIAPNDKDETCHDAFYYAIRSGNVKLLDTLINMWPDDYFAAHSQELDEVLSKDYEELKLKNVPLSDEIEIFVENKLINLRFFSKCSGLVQSANDGHVNIRERVNLVLENVALLKTEYLNEKEVDEKFLFISKFIAQNIHVLKVQLKSTYDRLPWEEIEFCLVSFVSCHVKRQEINLFYRSTLNKCRILSHLDNFANKLLCEIDIIKDVHIDKLSNLPKQKRDKTVAIIVSSCPQFEELYKDHQQIRDIHSLEKIDKYINLALSADPKIREGQIIITRVLQVIGEYVKNTLESPKLSNTTSELLLLSLPQNTRKIIIDLRNSLSHSYSLSKRTEIEENMNVNFFSGVQNDTNTIGVVISDILYKNKIKMVRKLLEKIVSSNNLDEIKEVAAVLSTVEWDKMIPENFKITEHDKLMRLIKKLSDNITDKTDYEEKMFNSINQIITSAGAPSQNVKNDFRTGFALLKSLCTGLSENLIDHNVLRGMKFRANQTLRDITPKIEHLNLKEIAMLAMKISRSLESRMQCQNLDVLNRLICEIFYIAEFGTGDIKYIEELRGKLNERGSFIPHFKQRKAYNLTGEKYRNHLALKLSELKDILSPKLLMDKSNEQLYLYKNDKKLQAVVEMLVLDILSILGCSKNCLENSLHFLDDNSPLLNGKCLRNHLAHDNPLVHILLSDPSIIVILNAKKLIEEKITTSKKRIGKFLIDDPFKLKEKYNQGLVNITYQHRMFIALEEGDLESFKDILKKGSDINARSNNSWTILHFAAKGPSLEVVKFILDQNLSVNVKDNNGQSPLHVAAAYGRKNIVELLINEAGLNVNDLDSMGKTPLHVAAQYGCKDTVVVLLKNKANIATQDKTGLSPLHYGIRNNHIDVTKILLAEDANVDINESMGGFTPLHGAAEYGHLEIVNFLLQNKANINVRNERNWTPIHAAALNGHLEIVKALILNGADVDAAVINGCTPLYYAVENGHEEIVSILLRHGANANAADKTFLKTPLHNAAYDGYTGIVKILLKNKAYASVTSVEGITPLHLAAHNNHLEIVTSLLKHGVRIHATDKKKATPLYYAVESGHMEVAELLIKYGAEVNAKAEHNSSLLHAAARNGYPGIVDLLIRNKAGINARDISGSTALHAAAINGSIDVIELLIINKGEVNLRNNVGMIPLHLAALKGHLDAIAFLIKNKAEVNAKNIYGLTPLHSAVLGGQKDAITFLIKNKAQIDARDTTGSTPLHKAVETGHKEIVEILVANGANTNVKINNLTALHYAIKGNHKDIAEVLIANGADVNTSGNEPLFLAVLSGYRAIVDILLKNKARVNIKGVENATPLHLAAKSDHKEIVNALIKSGANVNAETNKHITPLYIAAQEGHGEVVEILIKNGAGFNVINNEGTPLHIAAGHGHDGVVKILLNNGANINKDYKNRTPLELAVAHGHLQVVKMLHQYKKVDMNAKGNDDFTLLHIASQESNIEMVKYLVAEGCDINAINNRGSKSIHIAAREGHKDTVEFFISKGLSINEPGVAKQTVLHYAAMNGQLEVVRYLLSEGADVNAQDANGLSPMHLAASFGYRNVIEDLLKHGAVYNTADKLCRRPLDISCDENVIKLLASTEKLFMAVKHTKFLEVESAIAEGAFVNAKNVVGATPLHFAAWKGNDAVVNVLLQNKADPNAANNIAITSLHYAAKFSHLKVVIALLTNGAVHNPVSNCGKIPLDLAVDKGITSLFQLVSESFKNIKNGNSKYINNLNRIKDVDMIKAIMGARNKENETLVVAAINSNFSNLEQLKQISQGDVDTHIDMGLELLSQGNYQKAINILKNAFEKRKEILGPVNPGTLDIQMHIARGLYAQGSYQEALNAFEDIFQKQREMLGLNNKYTLITRSLIALVLHRQGNNEKALNIYQEVYRKQKEILPPNHSDIFDTQLHMGLVLDSLGKYEEALNMNRTVFEKNREILGDYAPITVRVQNNIAMVLSNQGKYEEALKIYKEVYEKKKVVFGINHSDTLRTLHNIAGVLFNQKKYYEALQSHQEVLYIQKNVLGPNHPDTLITQYNMANVLFAQAKWIGALKAYRECFDQMKAIFGSNHPKVLDILDKIEMINCIFKIEGNKESEILLHLQKEINIAVLNGDTQTVQRLIQAAVDVNDKDIDGRTPLHYAVSNRQIGIVNILLKAGANVTQVTNKGNTPLHIATSKGYEDIVEVLLQHVKRDKLNDFVNAKTAASGTTSLHVAVKNGYLNIVKSLLNHGAIYDIKNKESKIPLDFCQDQNVTDLLKLIGELFKDAKNGNLEIIKKLKTLKSDEFLSATNARNNQGNTLLQVAIINKNKNIYSKLLEVLKSPCRKVEL